MKTDATIPIFAPSYLRAGATRVTEWLPEVTLCVHQFEADAYAVEHGNVAIMPDAIRGNISRCRNWILDRAAAKGIKRFAIIDDDVRAVKRWVTHAKAVPFTPEEFREFMESGFILADGFGASVWGINPDNGKGGFRENTPFSLKSYVSGSFQCYTSPESRFDDRLPLKDDYDFCLQELNRNRRILRINRAFLVKADHKNRGGCSDYRTIIREREKMAALRAKWGGDIVKEDAGKCRTHRKGGAPLHDLNPIIRVPIGGV